jgi:hypothetical protein
LRFWDIFRQGFHRMKKFLAWLAKT